MAERKSDKARLEFFKRWHHMPEASWAAEMSHLDKEERQRVRESLSDPDDPSLGKMEWLRPRLLVALDTLDLINKPLRVKRHMSRPIYHFAPPI